MKLNLNEVSEVLCLSKKQIFNVLLIPYEIRGILKHEDILDTEFFNLPESCVERAIEMQKHLDKAKKKIGKERLKKWNNTPHQSPGKKMLKGRRPNRLIREKFDQWCSLMSAHFSS